MPTVILLDVSLSMTRPVNDAAGETLSRRELAHRGISTLMEYIAKHQRLEFVSLVIFSSLYEVVVPFTRNYEEIEAALSKIEDYDKTCVELALAGVRDMILDEWGANAACQVILITDGNVGVSQGSLKHSLHNYSKSDNRSFPLPYNFPAKLNIVLIASLAELQHKNSLTMFQKLVDINKNGEVYVADAPLSTSNIQQTFTKMATSSYVPHYAKLHCGNLLSYVKLHPAPESVEVVVDHATIKKTVLDSLHICGFLDSADISSPPSISRHLVLPVPKQEFSKVTSLAIDADDVNSSDDGKTPSFCVLLHGSLKVENMVALVQVSEDWYGMLYSWADNKKRSTLMMSLFEPGDNALPWLGKFKRLGPAGSKV
ncbi:integrator complex subunit 14-like [Anneissia japonica]|uniref:integrator complex subunit 14-like n=1 Tax=Anneissia japonica TaxID=1529436 RepID=UPI00142586EE|nr:integrator complex subunit 14-like [Anneissia japonica]XP_033108833.1 integrator complex subunit 14-like [Anneissia japonica]XP_033108834.1 integrator complex subunit 14-like [Anneissia japonica]XP_033108835.1 integrator complex subunit 14-like [Anneissia japonica]